MIDCQNMVYIHESGVESRFVGIDSQSLSSCFRILYFRF